MKARASCDAVYRLRAAAPLPRGSDSREPGALQLGQSFTYPTAEVYRETDRLTMVQDNLSVQTAKAPYEMFSPLDNPDDTPMNLKRLHQ